MKPRANLSLTARFLALVAALFIGLLQPASALNYLTTSTTGNFISQFDANGTNFMLPFADVGGTPFDLCIYNGKAYVSVPSLKKVMLYDAYGNAFTSPLINGSFITTLDFPAALRVANGRLYVSDATTNSIGTYNLETGAPINVALVTGLRGPIGFDFDGKGNLYVANFTDNSVDVYDANSGAVVRTNLLTSADGLSGVQDLRIANDTIYIANGGFKHVATYNLFGGLKDANLTLTDFTNLSRLLIDGDSLYVVDSAVGVARYNLFGSKISSNILQNAASPQTFGIVPDPTPTPTPTPTPAPLAKVVIAGAKKVTTTKASYLVKGTATNAKTVKVKVGKASARAVTGSTKSWRFTAKLKKGANVIVVVATNADGIASKPAKLTVVRK